MIDISKLEPTKHMFEWLSETPFKQIPQQIEEMYREQVPGTTLKSLLVTSDPDWLSGGIPHADDENKMRLKRAAVAFECDFTLVSSDGTHDLKGVFTWAAINLDSNSSTRTWMDLDGTLEEFGKSGELMVRVYFEEAEDLD